MLKSFEGIIDNCGLRSFQQAGGSLRLPPLDGGQDAVPFWANLDERFATAVLKELVAGNRRRALSLLEENAVSLGTIPAVR